MPSDTNQKLRDAGSVYVKAMRIAHVSNGPKGQTKSYRTFFGVFNEDGERLALVSTRKAAEALARRNQAVVLTVH